ncbi:MAG: right-handed parallel beta-helix repeat-containing protein, partial [Candidatus Eisenbacteria bacterium]|nr:right-handed parallel beta-helix repeat-containing protein [Candidatus Eisenbacteria bacterium]
VSNVLVRISDVSIAGTYTVDHVIPSLDDWSLERVTTTIPALSEGWHTISVVVDPDDEVDEIDESNNTLSTSVYAYPHVAGFPTGSGSNPCGPCVAILDDGRAHVLLMEGEARVRAIGQDGQTCWLSDPAADPVDYGPEITPAIGDLDGDGHNEIVAVRRMGLAAFDGSGIPLWQILTDDPVGAPVLADADFDGDLDVILATKMFFGGTSHIVAIDEDGTTIWSFSAPTGDPISATPVVGDFNQDGVVDFCYGTQSGKVEAASCTENPPVSLWGPIQLGVDPIRMLGLADLDGDGVLEIAAGGDAAYGLNADDGSGSWSVPTDGDVVALSLGDIDRDGVPDVVVGTAAGTLIDIENGGTVWTAALPGVPYWSPAIGDVIEDDQNEICVVTDDGSLSIIDPSGSEVIGPVPVPGAFGSPFVADLVGDGGLEICVASSAGRLFAFVFEQESDDATVQWMGPGGNEAHTGLLYQPFAGSFSRDTVLRGRYLITGDVTVEAGVTLSVQPGTVIEFDDAASPVLDVWGALQANGTPAAEIVMTSSGSSGRAGTWSGMRFRPGSEAALSGCEISGAETAVRGNQATIGITGCELIDNTYGVYLAGCALNAETSVFADSDSTGMYLSGGTGTIEDCVFADNVVSGLWLCDYASHHVEGSTFSGTSAGSGFVCYRFSNAAVDSCNITSNAEHGALVHNAAADFYACTITGNGKNGIHARKLAEPVVRWCTITGNRVGVSAETGAMPNIGLGDGLQPEAGFNSIYGNQVAAVANYNTNAELPLSARENWWGTYPPNGRIFIGYVRYTPCLESPPEAAPAIPTGTADTEVTPAAFSLGRCAPNPFGSRTSVQYGIPAGSGSVDVSVFDVAGRHVATLYSGHQEPGTHRVTWDGRDRFGNGVAAGIYFVRLETSDFRATAKMVLLR